MTIIYRAKRSNVENQMPQFPALVLWYGAWSRCASRSKPRESHYGQIAGAGYPALNQPSHAAMVH
jgi:hypothetical protein